MKFKHRRKKKVLSLVLCMAVMLSVMVLGTGAVFSDQDQIENTEAVDACSALNIIGGYEDGSYHPERNIKRSEVTKMICVALNGGKEPNLSVPATPTFTDVRDTADGWAEKYIESCVAQGIVSGVGGGRFSPTGNVTGSQLAKMLLVCLGYDSDIEKFTGNGWDTNVNVIATQKGIYEGLEAMDVSVAVTRDQAAQMVWNALQALEVRYTYTLVSENGQLVSKPTLEDKNTTLLQSSYSGASVYEGILTGSGDFGASKDKVAMKVMAINGVNYTDEKGNTSYADSFKYSEDMTALVGQYVKVLVNNKNDVYGVFSVNDENTVVTAAFSDVKLVSAATSAADGKVSINGTEYKFENDAKISGAGSDFDEINEIKSTATNSADKITFISNDGDNKFDLAIVNPMLAFSKVTYVGEDEITAGGETYDPAEDIIPSDLAKDDYVAVYTDLYTGNDKLVKADKVSGKVTGTKGGDQVTDVMIDGTWYQLVAAPNSSFEGMVGFAGDPAENGGTYDLYCINGVAYYVDEQQAGSTDTAYVLSTPGSLDVDGNYQVKLLFADGTTKVIGADKAYNDADNGGVLTGELVTYEINDGAYELTLVDDNNTAGGDSVADLTGFDKDTTKVTTAADGAYRVADSAVVYVVYNDGGAKQKVITGATLNALGANFGTDGVAVIDDGLATVVLLKSDSYLPGSNADKLYGYITSDIVSNKVDNVDYTSFTVWTSENESIDVKMKSTSVNVEKGGLISFELTEDNYIESVKSESGTGDHELAVQGPAAIKDFTTSWVSFYGETTIDYDFDADVQYMYVNTADVKGVNGGELTKASQTAKDGVYYANAKYVLEDGEIVLIVVDSKNKWDGAATISTTMTSVDDVEGALDNGASSVPFDASGLTSDSSISVPENATLTLTGVSNNKLTVTLKDGASVATPDGATYTATSDSSSVEISNTAVALSGVRITGTADLSEVQTSLAGGVTVDRGASLKIDANTDGNLPTGSGSLAVAPGGTLKSVDTSQDSAGKEVTFVGPTDNARIKTDGSTSVVINFDRESGTRPTMTITGSATIPANQTWWAMFDSSPNSQGIDMVVNGTLTIAEGGALKLTSANGTGCSLTLGEDATLNVLGTLSIATYASLDASQGTVTGGDSASLSVSPTAPSTKPAAGQINGIDSITRPTYVDENTTANVYHWSTDQWELDT